jgi:hypothetical protein
VRISLACRDYDRTRAIADGRIRPEAAAETVEGLFAPETLEEYAI